jgi:hypothetical protein
LAADALAGLFGLQAHQLDAHVGVAAAELSLDQAGQQVADQPVTPHGRKLGMQQGLLLRRLQAPDDVVPARAAFVRGIDGDHRVQVGGLQRAHAHAVDGYGGG